jgi:hypothetical protein
MARCRTAVSGVPEAASDEEETDILERATKILVSCIQWQVNTIKIGTVISCKVTSLSSGFAHTVCIVRSTHRRVYLQHSLPYHSRHNK